MRINSQKTAPDNDQNDSHSGFSGASLPRSANASSYRRQSIVPSGLRGTTDERLAGFFFVAGFFVAFGFFVRLIVRVPQQGAIDAFKIKIAPAFCT